MDQFKNMKYLQVLTHWLQTLAYNQTFFGVLLLLFGNSHSVLFDQTIAAFDPVLTKLFRHVV